MKEWGDPVDIQSRDYWLKITGMLQQNWALIDEMDDRVIVWFFGDTSGVFDEITFATVVEAARALKWNGFRRYADDTTAHEFISVPEPPFHRRDHPNGPIYSSGRFWKTPP